MFDNAIASLNEEDRDLSAIKMMKRYLMKGIGVHHGGLIPLLKELVEILFQESLVKVLALHPSCAPPLAMRSTPCCRLAMMPWTRCCAQGALLSWTPAFRGTT